MWVSVTGYMYYLYQLKNRDALAGPSLHFVRLIAFNGLPLQTLPMLQAEQPQMTALLKVQLVSSPVHLPLSSRFNLFAKPPKQLCQECLLLLSRL